jgi:hypothetical protein
MPGVRVEGNEIELVARIVYVARLAKPVTPM